MFKFLAELWVKVWAKLLIAGAKVVTITFNPAIDQNCSIDPQKISKDGIIRVGDDEQKFNAGGGGLNVSKVLKHFGVNSVLMGFVGGFVGKWIVGILKPLGVVIRFTKINGNSRVCNILNRPDEEFQILASGPVITDEEQRRFLRKYKRILPLVRVVVITGSIPKGVGYNFYRSLIKLAEDKKKLVIVDASKDLLVQAVSCKPFLVKPNEAEFRQLMVDLGYSKNLVTNEDIIEVAREELIKKRGIKKVLVSLGSKGSLLIAEKECLLIKDISKKKAVNTTGCGDTLIATYVAFYLCIGLKEDESIKMASAAAAGCAMNRQTAVFTENDYNHFYELIDVEHI